MVKSEPALLHLLWQLRQSFIDSSPIAKMLQPYRFAFLERLLQMEHPDIIDVVVEIEIDACCWVIE